MFVLVNDRMVNVEMARSIEKISRSNHGSDCIWFTMVGRSTDDYVLEFANESDRDDVWQKIVDHVGEPGTLCVEGAKWETI